MDLIIRFKNTGETLTVTGGFATAHTNQQNSYSIQAICFANGTVWEWEDIIQQPIHFRDSGGNYALVEGGTFIGTANADTINGSAQDDVIHGGAGNDTLNGNNGNDTLIGGTGNDTLNGGNGNDAYVYNLGDGNDVINENEQREGKRNVIVLGEGIDPDDIELLCGPSYSPNSIMDLIIRFKSTGETLTVTGGFATAHTNQQNSYSIQAICFTDGTVWEWADIVSQPIRMQTTGYGNLPVEGGTFIGTANADTINGSAQNDVIHGGAGNDSINGGNGNDTLIGGAGNDILNGGVGDDAYVYNLGDGNDVINENEQRAGKRNVIVLGEGIGPDDIELLCGPSYSPNSIMDLIIRFKNTGETLTVTGGFATAHANQENSYSIQAIHFADGTVWEWADIVNQPMLMQTTGYGNLPVEGGTLIGTNGDDTINGGAGDMALVHNQMHLYDLAVVAMHRL
jgi:Ca2+-binding RTX toxin-like protein